MEKFSTPSAPQQELAASKPRTAEEIVTEIDFILDHHEALRNKWEELIEGKPIETQLAQLEELAHKRREAMALKPYVSEHLVLLETFPEKAEILFKEFEHSLEQTSREVDRGYNGKIMEFVVPGAEEPNVVFKVLIRSPIGDQNDLLSEASHQADLHAFVKGYPEFGVGVPEVFYCATASNARVIAMQKVPGASIENIISEKMAIPADFDLESLKENLLDFVHELNETGFHHNDLREGNIMIDFDAAPGQPRAYIIDTGNAKRVYWKSEEEHKFDKSLDPAMLMKAFESLRNYKIRNKGAS
jgi:tRNA A-37 threonylcarbamoyl transferase component Bud32